MVAGNTAEENSSIFSLIDLNVLVAVNKGMQAVKLCSNKILQFTAVSYNGCKTVVMVVTGSSRKVCCSLYAIPAPVP